MSFTSLYSNISRYYIQSFCQINKTVLHTFRDFSQAPYIIYIEVLAHDVEEELELQEQYHENLLADHYRSMADSSAITDISSHDARYTLILYARKLDKALLTVIGSQELSAI